MFFFFLILLFHAASIFSLKSNALSHNKKGQLFFLFPKMSLLQQWTHELKGWNFSVWFGWSRNITHSKCVAFMRKSLHKLQSLPGFRNSNWGKSKSSPDTFKHLIFLTQRCRIFLFATCWQMVSERNKITAMAQARILLENYASAETIALQEAHWVFSVCLCETRTGRCLHFNRLFFPSHLSGANLRVMGGEAYCRENVYSSISSAERFSVEGCILCLPACRGGAPPLVLGPQLFVFLIGFFCEEQKSGGTHADVVCNQSRKQALEFILGDAHGDSDSVAWHFGVSSLSWARLKLTRDKSSGEIAYGTPSFKLGSFGKHDGRVKYVIFEHLALFCFCFFSFFLYTSHLLSSS